MEPTTPLELSKAKRREQRRIFLVVLIRGCFLCKPVSVVGLLPKRFPPPGALSRPGERVTNAGWQPLLLREPARLQDPWLPYTSLRAGAVVWQPHVSVPRTTSGCDRDELLARCQVALQLLAELLGLRLATPGGCNVN